MAGMKRATSIKHTHTHTHTRTHARTHARTHTHIHTKRATMNLRFVTRLGRVVVDEPVIFKIKHYRTYLRNVCFLLNSEIV